MLLSSRSSLKKIFTQMSRTLSGNAAGPIEQSIYKKIIDSLQPTSISITNDSHRHAGHSGNPSGSPDAETHFRVEVISTAFEGKTLVQRHRMVYGLLQEEIDAGVHALQLKTHTPDEATSRGGGIGGGAL